VADQARTQLTSSLNDQTTRVAEAVHSTADALRQAGEQLKQHNQAAIGDCLESTAEIAERVSGYFRQHDINAMFSDLENVARRQPAVFIGGAFVLGLMAARFMKSSGQHASSRGQQSWEHGGSAWGGSRSAWGRSEHSIDELRSRAGAQPMTSADLRPQGDPLGSTYGGTSERYPGATGSWQGTSSPGGTAMTSDYDDTDDTDDYTASQTSFGSTTGSSGPSEGRY
jgi:hypothetical protein